MGGAPPPKSTCDTAKVIERMCVLPRRSHHRQTLAQDGGQAGTRCGSRAPAAISHPTCHADVLAGGANRARMRHGGRAAVRRAVVRGRGGWGAHAGAGGRAGGALARLCEGAVGANCPVAFSSGAAGDGHRRPRLTVGQQRRGAARGFASRHARSSPSRHTRYARCQISYGWRGSENGSSSAMSKAKC